MEPKLVKSCFLNGECPDCGEPIPDDAVSGEECSNCGHVFWHDDDVDADNEEAPFAEQQENEDFEQCDEYFGYFGDSDY